MMQETDFSWDAVFLDTPQIPSEEKETRPAPRLKRALKTVAVIPRGSLEARFSAKNALIPEPMQSIELSQQDIIEIPETFEFTFEMEAVLFGLHVLLSECNFSYSLFDRIGYFPNSRDKQLYYLPIRRMKELYEAIGLSPKAGRHYDGEEKIRKGFIDLMDYQHPIITKTWAGSYTDDDKKLFYAIVRIEKLFDALRFYRVPEESNFLPRRPSEFRGRLQNLVVLFNPFFFSDQDVFKNFRKLDTNLFREVEESRKKLAAMEGKAYWRREPTFLSLGYYLLKQGGKFVRKDGKIVYRIERETTRLLEKLNLLERYKENRKDAKRALERSLNIYKDMGYIHDVKRTRTRGKGLSKYVILLNKDKYPHLKYRLFKFHKNRPQNSRGSQ